MDSISTVIGFNALHDEDKDFLLEELPLMTPK